MGGNTISNDPKVIAREELQYACRSIESAILRTHALWYPYQGERPNGAQVDATVSTLRVLLQDETYGPIARTALGLPI